LIWEQRVQRRAVRADIGSVVAWLELPTKRRRSALGAAALAVLACAILATTIALPSPAGAANGAPRAVPRQGAHVAIVGGQPAQPSTFPWMAYVLDFRGNSVGQCSGTVVAPNLVLTAGHCAEDVQTGVVNEASGYQVTTGNVDWAAPETERQVSGVARVIVCGCFDRHTTVGDVALLQLSTPTSAPPIALASSPPAGTAALLAGWGQTSFGQEAAVEQLQWAPTAVQSAQWCEREATPFSPSSEICTIEPPARQTGACHGDSGGPLLVADPSATGGMVQIGVTSHNYGDCATTSPSVFTRLDAVAAWVRGWAQALAGAPPASTPLRADLVAAPTLAGVASGRSLSLGSGAISLVLACESEGGVCSGEADAIVKVREERIARRGGIQTVSTHSLEVTLAGVVFSIAPGASVAVHAKLSSQNRTLLSRLGGGPLEVMLTGRGITHRVMRAAKSCCR
jgi:secreted trypsin-like serine protease